MSSRSIATVRVMSFLSFFITACFLAAFNFFCSSSSIARRPVLEGKNELVARAIKCPQTAVIFRPDDQVFELIEDGLAGREECRHGPGRPETDQVRGARMNK